VSFAAITLCVASQRVFIVVYFVIDSVRKLLGTSSYALIFDLVSVGLCHHGHGASSCCGWRRRPLDMEDSCEYIGINTMLSGPLIFSACRWHLSRKRGPEVTIPLGF
jgi:hypothetical protein